MHFPKLRKSGIWVFSLCTTLYSVHCYSVTTCLRYDTKKNLKSPVRFVTCFRYLQDQRPNYWSDFVQTRKGKFRFSHTVVCFISTANLTKNIELLRMYSFPQTGFDEASQAYAQLLIRNYCHVHASLILIYFQNTLFQVAN